MSHELYLNYSIILSLYHLDITCANLYICEVTSDHVEKSEEVV